MKKDGYKPLFLAIVKKICKGGVEYVQAMQTVFGLRYMGRRCVTL